MASPRKSSPRSPDQRRLAVFRRDEYRCVYCGEQFPVDELTLDHVQPRMKQGDRSAGNLVTACGPCNVSKGRLTAWRYLSTRPAERANFIKYAIHVWPRHRRAVEEEGK